MKIKTSELKDADLDWAVAVCEKFIPDGFEPSTNWADGGPIIEREEIFLAKSVLGGWTASIFTYEDRVRCSLYEGPTPLIAAMRCYVASKLGEEIDVPTLDSYTTL